STALQVPALARSLASGTKYVELMNLLALPFGLKLSSVLSIRSQEIRAAAAPAPRAQGRTRPLGLALAVADGGIGGESRVSIGRALIHLVDKQGWILKPAGLGVNGAPAYGRS